jgi:hypothetical protein
MSNWEIIRQQGVIGGRLVNESNAPIGFVNITLSSIPEPLRAKAGEQSDALLTTTTRPDGYFCFFNLPDGAYTVTAEYRNQKVQKSATVKRDPNGNFRLPLLDLRIAASGSF